MTDKEAVLEIAKRKIYLDTISFEYLDEFETMVKFKPNVKVSTIRNRFRKALNELADEGYCVKRWIGTTYYQTSDTLGGKSCLMYEFDGLFKNNG